MNLIEDLARPTVNEAGQMIVAKVKPEPNGECIEAKIERELVKANSMGEFKWFPDAIPYALGGFALAWAVGFFGK